MILWRHKFCFLTNLNPLIFANYQAKFSIPQSNSRLSKTDQGSPTVQDWRGSFGKVLFKLKKIYIFTSILLLQSHKTSKPSSFSNPEIYRILLFDKKSFFRDLQSCKLSILWILFSSSEISSIKERPSSPFHLYIYLLLYLLLLYYIYYYYIIFIIILFDKKFHLYDVNAAIYQDQTFQVFEIIHNVHSVHVLQN